MASNEKNLNIKLQKLTLDTDQGISESEEKKWGFPLKDMYKLAVNFYKEKEGKAFHLSYEDKLKLVAFTQQATNGPFNEETAQPLGVFDVIGRDRRFAWLALGNLSQVQAMAGFIHHLDRLCQLFKPYVEAIQRDEREKDSKRKTEEKEQKSREELQKRSDLEKQNQQNCNVSSEEQIRRIKDALNAQTYDQFFEYAQQQFPGNFDQQAVLIRQLQDQHYHQYIQQLAMDQRLCNTTTDAKNENELVDDKENGALVLTSAQDSKVIEDNAINLPIMPFINTEVAPIEERDDSHSEEGDGFPPVEEARMWTRDDADVFRAAVGAGEGRGVLRVRQGEACTVRVPTHPGGRCLFWEFATDHYDIGFGMYFEWSKSPTDQVTIHVSDSDDDDDPDDSEVFNDDETESGDVETGGPGSALHALKPPVSVVVPIYRRDSNLQVYAGSHTYPGEGIYLLKFDNTYSLWRSKTLYYRVYYTR